jgi:peptidoglycan/LPS O-acetylase OafA/YrhL
VYLDGDGKVNTKTFWTVRFARIYPLFLFTLVLDTPHSLAAAAKHLGFHHALLATFKTFAVNLVLLQGWFVSFRGIDNPNWSLSVEALFYALFPLIAWALTRLRPSGLWMTMALSYAVGIQLIAVAVHAGMRADAIKFNPALHLHEFVEGVCAGLLVLGMDIGSRQFVAKWSPWALTGSLVTFALFIVASYRMLNYHLFIHDGLLSPLFLVVLVALTFGNSFFHRILSHPWLVLLGESSYGLYLIHIPIWHLIKPLPHGHSLITYPVFLLGAVGSSLLIFHYLEKPARKLIIDKVTSRPTPLVAS